MIEPFVDVAFLEHRLSDVYVADVRYYLDGRRGLDAYNAGHIPGATFVDLDSRLAAHGDAAAGGRHPLPAAEAFARALAELGIADDDTVIAYDDAGGVMAARLVWMLRATGREAALLDGGIQAWPHRLSTDPVHRPRTVVQCRPWPEELLASIDDAASAAERGIPLIDGRQRERFDGAPDDLDPRAGHIPGARSVPCRENLTPEGRLKSVEALKATFAAAGVTEGGDVISYCGSGVTASHNLLSLEYAGLGRGRLFPGSWSQWSRDPDRPIETAQSGAKLL